MTQVVPLLLLLGVVQDDHGGVEVDDLPGRQQVEVGATVAAAVAIPDGRSVRERHLIFSRLLLLLVVEVKIERIHPLQLELAVRQRHLVVKAVGLPLLVRDMHGDGTTAEEHPHEAVV